MWILLFTLAIFFDTLNHNNVCIYLYYIAKHAMQEIRTQYFMPSSIRQTNTSIAVSARTLIFVWKEFKVRKKCFKNGFMTSVFLKQSLKYRHIFQSVNLFLCLSCIIIITKYFLVQTDYHLNLQRWWWFVAKSKRIVYMWYVYLNLHHSFMDEILYEAINALSNCLLLLLFCKSHAFRCTRYNRSELRALCVKFKE